MELYDLLYGISFEVLHGDILAVDIKDIAFDSRKPCKDSIFVCIKGKNYDSHKDFNLVCNKGAKVVIVDRYIQTDRDVLVLKVVDTRKALSYLCINFFGNPASDMKMIGITGTKGKTSTAIMTKSILDNFGYKCGVIGSLGVKYGDVDYSTENTTPQPYELNKILSNMRKDGVDTVIMEVSALGLYHNRIAGINFDISIFTNIAKDEIKLEELPTLDDYINSMKKLFNASSIAILNADDSFYNQMIVDKSLNVIKFGLTSEAHIRATDISLIYEKGEPGIKYDILFSKKVSFFLHQLGRQNVYNSLAALSTAHALGIDINSCKSLLTDIILPGRAEIIKNCFDRLIILDCAITPVGFDSIFEAVKEYKRNNIKSVISIEDIDDVKHEQFIDIALTYSDVCAMVCNKDYNLEEKYKDKNIEIFFNRKEAIINTIINSSPKDIILILGKGCYDKTVIQFDYTAVNEALEKLNDSKFNC